VPNLSVTAWIGLGALVIILGLSVGLKVQTMRLNAVKHEYEVFQVQVKTLGEAQEQKTKLVDADNKAKKEKSDAENAKTHATLTVALNGLRAQHPSSSFVPSAPSGTSRPDLICFNRADYIRTDGIFTSGARGLSDEGTAATLDLNTAKEWATKAR